MPSDPIDDLRKSNEKIWGWINSHDGRIDAWWEAQHKLNDKVELSQMVTAQRLSAVEKKIMFISGFAAMFGAVVGSLFRFFIESIK